MTRLSILIPCIQEAGCFEATLASVLQNRPEECEVLVVQSRSYDDPYDLKDEVRFVQAPADGTLVDLVNFGINAAVGDIVHLLSCDTEVSEGWTQTALQHFQDPVVGSVSPLIVARRAANRVVARGVRYGARGVRRVCGGKLPRRHVRFRYVVAPTFSAGIYRRRALLEVGGFCADVGPELADVDLGLMLQAAGYGCVHEERSVVTTEHEGIRSRLSFARGRAAERLFWRNVAPADRTCVLLAHPLTWLTECLCNVHRPEILLQMLGRISGFFERSRHRGHQGYAAAPQIRCDTQPPTVLAPETAANAPCRSAPKSRAAA